VLKVDTQKGQVDLSLRRVNDRERRGKTNQLSLENRAEKIVAFAAKELNIEPEALYTQVAKVIFEDYEYLYDAFLDIVEGELELSKTPIDKRVADELTKLVIEKIKPQQISIKGHLSIETYEELGVEDIKACFKEAQASVGGDYSIKYEGGGSYCMLVMGEDYPQAEQVLKGLMDFVNAFFESKEAKVSFERV
jgi:translation initiation factor 2 subunit 1